MLNILPTYTLLREKLEQKFRFHPSVHDVCHFASRLRIYISYRRLLSIVGVTFLASFLKRITLFLNHSLLSFLYKGLQQQILILLLNSCNLDFLCLQGVLTHYLGVL